MLLEGLAKETHAQIIYGGYLWLFQLLRIDGGCMVWCTVYWDWWVCVCVCVVSSEQGPFHVTWMCLIRLDFFLLFYMFSNLKVALTLSYCCCCCCLLSFYQSHTFNSNKMKYDFFSLVWQWWAHQRDFSICMWSTFLKSSANVWYYTTESRIIFSCASHIRNVCAARMKSNVRACYHINIRISWFFLPSSDVELKKKIYWLLFFSLSELDRRSGNHCLWHPACIL